MYRKLHFGIVSTQIVESDTTKYVSYTVEAKIVSEMEDPKPSYICRRYSDFLNLYEKLSERYPIHMSRIEFPSKTYFWNFNQEVISARSAAFDKLLQLINSESILKYSSIFTSFLQVKEMAMVLRLIRGESYTAACALVENCFNFMNKVETDRSPNVLRWLCMLVAVLWKSGNSRAYEFAELAMRRYDGVSDIDLLKLYVPFLHVAESVYQAAEKDVSGIQEIFESLRSKNHDYCRHSNDLITLLLIDFSKMTGQ